MKVLSLFDGISCGMEALKRANIHVEEYHAFEIDPYAIKISKKNHPEIIHHGDVRGADFSKFKDFDLLIGGNPCNSFSFSGKGLAFEDDRGKLFYEYIRAKEEISPKYFLLENVVMKKQFQEVFDNLMKVEALLINSSLLSAQNRKRLYWTNIPNIKQPIDKQIFWKDVCDKNVSDISYYYSENALDWLARHSRNNEKFLKVYNSFEEKKMQMIEASHSKKYSSQRFFGIIDFPLDEMAVASMRGRRMNPLGKRADYSENQIRQMIEFRRDGKSNCLTTVNKDNIVVSFTLPNSVFVEDFFFRYITVEECERLQTLRTGYTEGVSKSQRYKMIGNGWTVDVIKHIFENLKGL